MLAWLHQATASEKEHLEALLKHVTQQGRMSSPVYSHLKYILNVAMTQPPPPPICFVAYSNLVSVTKYHTDSTLVAYLSDRVWVTSHSKEVRGTGNSWRMWTNVIPVHLVQPHGLILCLLSFI